MRLFDNFKTIYHRRPGPTLMTVAFAGSVALTVAYFAGLIPGVPKTLPMFIRLVIVTVCLFTVTLIAWVFSFARDVTVA